MNNKHFKVFLDGTEFDVEIEAVDDYGIEVLVNGKIYKVEFEDIEENLAKEKNDRQPTRASSTPENIPENISASRLSAPMPGDVIEIMVNVGQQITAGQELFVLEAMKMKNVIRSPRAGKISEIGVVAGQSVKHGETLLEFE